MSRSTISTAPAAHFAFTFTPANRTFTAAWSATQATAKFAHYATYGESGSGDSLR